MNETSVNLVENLVNPLNSLTFQISQYLPARIRWR